MRTGFGSTYLRSSTIIHIDSHSKYW